MGKKQGAPMRAFIAMILLAGSAACVRKGPTRDGSVKAADSAAQAIATQPEYMGECEKAIGPLPAFSCHDEAFYTFESTRDGVKIADAEFQTGTAKSCDQPAGLLYATNANQCAPYSRIARYFTSEAKTSRWVVFCRRYYFRPKDSPLYDEINLIGHNEDTGATCFVNTHLNDDPAGSRAIDGTSLAHPRDATAGRTWMAPAVLARNGSCTECHSTGPWLRSPYLAQAKMADGLPVLPDVKAAKHQIVAAKMLHAAWKASVAGAKQPPRNDQWNPRILKSVPTCSGCHNIGNGAYYCPLYTSYATGTAGNESEYTEAFHDPSRPTQRGFWHVEGANKKPPEAFWHSEKASEAVRKIHACCATQASGEANPQCEWESGLIEPFEQR